MSYLVRSARSRPARWLAPLIAVAALVLTLLALAGGASPATAQNTPPPDSVTIAGTIQSVLGCDGDWQPECDATALSYDPAQDAWLATFDLPAGEYEYKAALNESWDENYGLNAEPGGANIPLVLAEDTRVTFFYDHKSHWVSDTVNSVIATLPGTHQDELGCPPDAHTGDWEPGCLRTWLQDPDGDGVYTFSTVLIPAGDYMFKVAIGRSWDTNYGEGGAAGGADIPYSVPADGHEVTFTFNADTKEITYEVSAEPVVSAEELAALREAMAQTVPPPGDLSRAEAYWVSEDTIVWDVDEGVALYRLHYDPAGALAIEDGALVGGEMLSLSFNRDGLSDETLAKFPHLAGMRSFKIKEEDIARVPELLKGQVAVSVSGSGGTLLGATALQIPGVLDDLYTYDGPLGVTFADDQTPTFRLWAPTAKNVALHVFPDSDAASESTVHPMDYDAETGVWSVTGAADWYGQFYLYEVEVFTLATMQVETNLVTDPYSVSLSMNSQRSQIIDLSDPAYMPDGWQSLGPTLEKPPLPAFEDASIYELHIRDFSVRDDTVPPDLQGTFMAFTLPDTDGMQHLKALAQAGLTHLHLLPAFDIATINENPAERVEPSMAELATYGPAAEEQQAIIAEIRDQDAFNWGYDPYHYTVPEGSYSTDPDGAQRIIEFRAMVMGLNQEAGLRLVMDVVYNHTNAAGQAEKSVLDKIVPGYYYRLNSRGAIETSSCCPNTATEHNMMRKLMVDSVVTWATAYKVDGFRFDLMGLHMLADMAEVRAALDALTLEDDGVDGSKIYVYGEGWNHGELANNVRGLSATQLDIGGLGIGTFNDRVRDAAKGVTPFSAKTDQGFINGLYTAPNAYETRTPEEQLARLLWAKDLIRVALAGNLRNYSFLGAEDEVITGAQVDYGGQPAGYTLDPQEHIIYVSAHDNETLFDVIQYSAPADATLAERVRMQNLGLSIVTLGQGVPFFHAGSDLLRSKSGDQDSYNSGDWFNALDFTYNQNNWGLGLPPAEKNQGNWDLLRPLLANPDLMPGQEHIVAASAHLREMLNIRYSSKLFRLETFIDVQNRVAFHNTGSAQVPGLIVMSITDQGDLADLDPNHELIVVVFNAAPDELAFGEEALAGVDLMLHPVQAASADEVVRGASFDPATGTFTVPGRTAAVFVLPQAAD